MKIPSIVPAADTIYLVVNDFGAVGRAFVETDILETDLETVLRNIANGEYSKPVRVVALNTAEEWSRDVTTDVSIELLVRAERNQIDLGAIARDFVEYHTGRTLPVAE